MGRRWRCFFLHETDQVEVSLRRYHSSLDDENKCPGSKSYHDASEVIARRPRAAGDRHKSRSQLSAEELADPAWPTHCACGYAFTPDDEWQVNVNDLYRRSDDATLTTIARAPVGAMWDADWYRDFPNIHPGEDGRVLVLKCPAGDWIIDGEASNGTKGQRGWTRSGEPPDVTANPSIGFGEGCKDFHGWLKNGWLEEC